jgi:Uma2 family endonuclease
MKMSSTLTPPQTMADLLERLGGIAPERVHLQPAPGTAVEEDVENYKFRNGRKHLLELVEGTLVEKPVGQYESQLAMILGHYLLTYLDQNPIGIVVGADGGHRLGFRLVRMPDVSFLSQDRLDALKTRPAVVPFAPDLAVEVISPGNTDDEMERKLQEYFDAGVKLVWYVYPQSQTVLVYRHPQQCRELTLDDTLEGGDVLPGFSLPIREWFSRAV